tara:strand:- start:1096 stop:2448 length:1353 start_codon:yes stop_codon:yes gene_type:complete
MSDRGRTIWNLIVGISLISIVAAGLKLFPMNKKYDRIKDRSRNLQFGTDEELENVIAFLEKRLEERNNYQFIINKEPMVLTNVLSLDGSGRRSRRNKSAIRVALIYQRENNFQAQIDYRGKIFGISAGDFIENIGDVVLIDKNQVIIKNENRLMSYPAPGIKDGLPKELSNFSLKGETSILSKQSKKQSEPISALNKNDVVPMVLKSGISNNVSKIQKPGKNHLNNRPQGNKPVTELVIGNARQKPKKTVPPESLVEGMFNIAIAKKNEQSPNKNRPLFDSDNKSAPTTIVKKVKKPAVDYGISALSPMPSKQLKSSSDTRKIKKRSKQLNNNVRNNNSPKVKVVKSNTDRSSLQAKGTPAPTKIRAKEYPTWKHELQALLGIPKPIVNGNPGLMSFNELKVVMKTEKNIDSSIFQQTYKDVGYDNFQKYLDENGTNIITMLRSRKNSSL